jgi:glucan biosynthesis protein C
MNTLSANIARRYDLDWLRVLAILGIFVFHTTRLFDTEDWLIKNTTTYPSVDVWHDFATSWGMPLILLISGASIFFTLEKINPGKYVKGLVVRLFVPLLVGIFTHVALQIYLEKLSKGLFSGSFFSFYPHYFDGMYGFGGNFAWMGLHLWYLEALFIFSLLLLPLFWWLKTRTSGQRILRGLGDILAKPGAAFLLALPVVVLIYSLDPDTWGNRSLGGWSLFIYPWFLISGFVIISHGRLQDRIQDFRWFSLVSGMVLSSGYLFVKYQQLITLPTNVLRLEDPLLSLSGWCWLLAAFGFGMKHLTRSTPFLQYANQATLPFYILHQTVIVILGYFLVSWAIPDWLKFILVLIGTFLVSISLYEFLVRRFNLMRFLFGMKLLSKPLIYLPMETQLQDDPRTLSTR